MFCYSCKYCKKSKSKIYKNRCVKFNRGILDDLNGCSDGEYITKAVKSVN